MTLLNKNRIAKLAGLLKEQAVDEWIDEESADDDLVLGGGAASGSIHDEEEFEDDEEDEEDDITVYGALEDDDLEELDPDTDLGLYGEPLERHQPDKHFAHHTGMYEGLSPEDYLADDHDKLSSSSKYNEDVGTLGSIFSDTYKELHGVRPRHIDTRDMSKEELLSRIEDLRQQIADSPADDEDRMSDYEDEEENRHAGGSIKFETLKRIIRNIVKENEENFDDKTAAQGNKAKKPSNEKPKEPVDKYGANLSKKEPTFEKRKIGNYSQPLREPIIPENLRRMIREAVRRHLNEKKKGLPPWLKPGFKNKKKTDDKSCESDPTSKKKTPSKNKPFFLKKKSKK